jgi:CHAT domain-containing protein/cytochrome c-type biogenesis protein CcmH/NrfG
MARADEHSIRRYLLGRLTEAEEEQVELRLLADPDFAEEYDIVVNEITDDYVAGKFAGEELKQIETYFFKHPERRQKLKFARALKQRKSEMVTVKGHPKRSYRPYLAIAATLLLVVGGFYAWRIFSTRNDIDKGLAALQSAFRDERPFESRISELNYAPHISTRGPGTEKVDQNELSRAELWLQEALKKNRAPAVLHALGKVYLAKRDYDRSVQNFEEALKGDPNNAQLYSDLGAALIEMGERDQSGPERHKGTEELARGRENITKALSLSPNLLEALFNRALCSEYQKLREQAKEEWKQYLAVDSTSPWAVEARERLRKLEEQSSKVSRTSGQIPRDFLSAYQSRNDEGAWAALSRSRTRFGNSIVEALLDEHLSLAIKGQSVEATEVLQMISYAGKVEEAKVGDRYTSDLTQFYRRAGAGKHGKLVQARALMKDARKLYGVGEFESASLVYVQARDAFAALEDECDALVADSLVGYCYLRIPKPQESISIFQRLSRAFEKRGHKSLFAQTLPALADAESSLGEFSKTLDYADRGLKVSNEIQDTVLGIRCLAQNLSTLLALGDYRGSLESLNEAVDLADTIGRDPTLTWQLYIQAAFDFHFLGFSSSALAFQQEALKLATAANVPLLRSRTWEQMAVLYGEQKNYDEAIRSGEKALAEGQNISGSSRDNVVASSTLTLGKLHLAAGHQRIAIQKFDESISTYQKLKFYAYLYEAHKEKLRALIDLHEDAAAAAELETTLALFEENRQKISEESNRDIFFDAGQDTYDIAADFAYSRLKDEKRAFEYAEASRARSLFEMMNRGARVKEGRSLPDIDLVSQTANLKLDQIQSGLPERAQMLWYSLLPDKLIVWVITKEKFESVAVGLNQGEFERMIYDYQKLVMKGSSADDETRRTAAKELYSRLISPIESKLDPNLQIFIAADKALHYLSFATLISPATSKYLIENYVIATAPSASVLIWTSDQARKKAGARDETVLSVGKPNFDQNAFTGLSGLPGADREARAVAASYRSRTLLIGPDALAYRVKNELKGADVIHLATHAVADARSPLLTKLLLTGGRQDGVSSHHASNGFLQASEIYEMKLPRARLAVLSACQTGIERAYRGEGAIGMARPFLVAGVPVVVASLWPVDSELTADLMIKFHEYRTRDHKPTIEALRQAQLYMINHPPPGSQGTLNWAAFVVIGGYAEY